MDTDLGNNINGWIEKNIGNNFYGWFGQKDETPGVNKFIHIHVGGILHKSIPVIEATNSRADLATVPNIRVFQFEFDAETFYTECANCNIAFSIYSEPKAYFLKLLPELVLKSSQQKIKSPRGLAFKRESADQTAMLGAGGQIFLRSGTNNLDLLYSNDITIDLDGWYSLFIKRLERSKTNDYQYIQILIPEKTSVLYWSAPYEAHKGSPSFNSLNRQIENTPTLSSHFIKGFDWIPDEVHSESLFRPYDSHFSTLGAKTLVNVFLSKFFEEYVNWLIPTSVYFGNEPGDLGSRFQALDGDVVEKPPFYEELRTPENEIVVPVLVNQYDPVEGNNGTLRVWRCEQAPIKKKVVCFGDSFFERGEVSNTLSWWFSRLFTEFHFCWSPEQSEEYITSVSPDIVISETIERFLTVLPKKMNSLFGT
ncbi:hypothetical protein CFN58_26245 [Pseudomonas avellanae]|uniref:AlgX/AlgJ SGNH hydrolase-like domain-containing protein n=2 Tax=Pseudomonas syringae group TaxID=136849 RepID=A0A261WDG7_9PSED|nr:hypothetical protein [Pseudomonas syringae]ATV16436.1 hypothetical protein CT122_05540 [Pseudomonas syringae pv. actinidiae]OZI84191.1 hypothetical protein CFN58_26245 [Pseudomonas avellanae]PIN58960.1 hypothetical protein CUB86_24880 [Pseudomonas syringae pv. actinidiae]